MAAPAWREREPRKAYRDLSFPDWVKVTDCVAHSQTEIFPTTHGIIKVVVSVKN